MDSVNLTRRQIEMLEKFVQACEEENWKYALIGAMALQLHGIKLLRQTQDMDFAVLLHGEQDFQTLGQKREETELLNCFLSGLEKAP